MMFKAGRKTLDLSKPVLMGVLNVTPDSFSDGGHYFDFDAAVQRGLVMARQGAMIIDVGGESTRPGAKPITATAEKKRVLPVIRALSSAFKKAKSNALISVDTHKPDVAQAALEAGADIVNDVTGFRNATMRAVVGKAHGGAIVMHMQGTPSSMQENPQYGDVVGDVKAFLETQARMVLDAGASGVMIDPGIGFGKTLEHNLALLRRLDEFVRLGYPVCVGVSRKRFIGTLTGEPSASKRLEGTLAAVTACVLAGVQVLRVHDVSECRNAVEVAYAMRPSLASVSDEIRVHGIVLKCRIGILPKEKTPQIVLANVIAYLDLSKAAKSQDVKDTLDYRRIVKIVEKTAASRHWPLLEGLAESLAEHVKTAGARRVVIQLTKPDALKNGVPSICFER